MATSSPRRRKAAEAAPVVPSPDIAPPPLTTLTKKTAARKKAPAEVPVASAPVDLTAPDPVAAKPARKRAPARKAVKKTEAPQAAETPRVDVEAPKPRKRAPAAKKQVPAKAVQPRPEYELGARPEGALFGRYELRRVADGSTVRIRLRGSQLGHYSCSCTDFSLSENGHCAHVNALLELLVAEAGSNESRTERVHELARGESLPHSEIWLAHGLERHLMLKLGQASDAAWLAQVSAIVAGAQPAACGPGAVLRFSPEPAQTLFRLMQAASSVAHTLVVDDEVWPQVAWSADAQERVRRLEAMLAQGPHSDALQALLREPLPAFRWESALFAVCAGRALLADDLGLGQQAVALAALALWRDKLGLGAAVVAAPAERHAHWRAEALRWLGAWPERVALVDLDGLPAQDGVGLLIVDAVQDLQSEQALRALASSRAVHLLLLADRELLGEDILAPLVAVLDPARRGPMARLHALAPDASKREQREALETVMLSRRRRDLQGQLPMSFDTIVGVELPQGEAIDGAQDLLRASLAQWQQHAYMPFAEQLQLMQELTRLRAVASSEAACEAKTQALLALLPRIVPSAAQRVLVLAQQDQALSVLAQRLQEQGLPVLRIHASQGLDERQALCEAWRGDAGLLLLASDAACAGLDLRRDNAALVHFDMPWNPAQLARRVRLLAGEEGAEGAGLPVWHLRVAGSFDEVQARVHSRAMQVPAAGLDFEPGAQPFLQGAELQAFMQALAQGLDSK